MAAEIDRALAPYAGRLRPSELAWMRDQMAETLATDAHAARALRDARPRVVERSGDVPVAGARSAPAKPGLHAGRRDRGRGR